MENDSDFEKLILEKIDKGVNLTEKELKRLVRDFPYKEHVKEEGIAEAVSTIVKLQDRYFSIFWWYFPVISGSSSGFLDEFNSKFPEQPVKVDLKSLIKGSKHCANGQEQTTFKARP